MGAFELSVDIFNVANLLNKEWGVNESYGNTAMYKIKSFDPVKNSLSIRKTSVAAVWHLYQETLTRFRLERSTVFNQ